MTDSVPGDRSGGCLCEAVRYRAPGGNEFPVLHCHCENCRRLSGNYIAAVRVRTAELVIDDRGQRLRWYDLPYARYGFCQDCGSTLFYQPADRSDITSVMAGTLDQGPDLEVGGVWFADEARPYSTVSVDVPHHTGNG